MSDNPNPRGFSYPHPEVRAPVFLDLGAVVLAERIAFDEISTDGVVISGSTEVHVVGREKPLELRMTDLDHEVLIKSLIIYRSNR